ncbi:MAG: FkbM family methyltransferase, partial [Selenomonadaceae bacterium]|nr:FkbM family methyltransferase [Selenomonadaceae bacterium]
QKAYRLLTFHIARQLNYFMSCTTADGLHYVATSKDDIILGTTYLTQKNWSEESMRLFRMLTDKFYRIDDGEGLFLDLGANIGTTGIYFLKKIAPKLKLIAFEPDAENFKLLRANLILNDLYENAVAENCGLGDEESEMPIYRNAENPGHNGMLSNDSGVEGEKVKIIPLDKYFADKKLSPKDVKYIWIDTEGFEPRVLLGMKNILTENPAPIFMEFNPRIWQESGYFDKMVEFLKGLYEGYVWTAKSLANNNIEVYPIEKLLEFKNSQANFGEFGDIFLIHKLEL